MKRIIFLLFLIIFLQAELKANNKNVDPIKVACVGNSITYGAGISGDRTQHAAWRVQNGNYEKCNPEFTALAIGVNNFSDNTAKKIGGN